MKQRFINARTVVFVYRSTKRKTVRISRTVPGILLLLVVALSLISCAGITKRNALPEPYVEEAGIEGIPFARFWGDEMPPDMDKRMALAYEQIKKLPLAERYYRNDYLALSGGWRKRRIRGRPAGWMDCLRHPSDLQNRIRHQHRCPYCTVCLSGTGV